MGKKNRTVGNSISYSREPTGDPNTHRVTILLTNHGPGASRIFNAISQKIGARTAKLDSGKHRGTPYKVGVCKVPSGNTATPEGIDRSVYGGKISYAQGLGEAHASGQLPSFMETMLG